MLRREASDAQHHHVLLLAGLSTQSQRNSATCHFTVVCCVCLLATSAWTQSKGDSMHTNATQPEAALPGKSCTQHSQRFPVPWCVHVLHNLATHTLRVAQRCALQSPKSVIYRAPKASCQMAQQTHGTLTRVLLSEWVSSIQKH